MTDMNIEKRIMSTNDWGLLAILHEGLIERCTQAKESIENEEYDKLNDYNNASRHILAELVVLFKNEDADEDIAENLREIYLYVNKIITEGGIKKDISKYDDAIKVITPLLEGFKEKEVDEVGRVVSGLTYGSQDLEDHTTKSTRTFEG